MNRKPPIVERAKIAWKVFKNGFQRRPAARLESKQIPFLWPAWRDGNPQWQIVDLSSYIREGFETNTLIYSAVMYKVRAAGMPRLRAYTGGRDHPELLPSSHPLSKLVARPNPSMSWREFQGIQDAFLNLSGNAYTYLDRPNRGSLPTAMYPMHPSRVFVVPSGRGVKGFLYVPEGKNAKEGIPMLPEDVSHVKLPNPGDPLEGNGYGMSPVSSMAHSADVDNMITKFLRLFFEQGAAMPGLLKFDLPLDDPTIAVIKDRWKEMYGGYENWTDIGVLDQGGDYQRIGLDFEEMGFETQDERNESRILGPFGVPPILIGSRVGLARSTYSNYVQARSAFWEDTMSWEIGLFEDDYQYYLQTDDGGFVAFDLSEVPALRKDVPTLVTAWKGLVENGIPKAMAAEVVGLSLGDLPDGNVVYMPVNYVPIGESTSQPAKISDSNQGAVEAERDERRESGKSSKAWTPEQKAAHWKAVDLTARSWESRFKQGGSEAFEKDKREILALLSGAKEKARRKKATIDWSTFEGDVNEYLESAGLENWRSTFVPLIKGVVTDQAERWATDLGMEFDVQNLFARDWFNQYVLVFAQEINLTTKNQVAEIVTKAQKEGATIPQMQDQLTALFNRYASGLTPEDPEFQWYTDRLPAYRTEIIARTETTRSSSAGTDALFREWNVGKREWLATKDNRVRDDHAEADGQVKAMNEPFIVGGIEMMYPGDPSAPIDQSANCRCTILPVIED